MQQTLTRRGLAGAGALGIAGLVRLAMPGGNVTAHEGYHPHGTPVASPVVVDPPRDGLAGRGTLRTVFGKAMFSLSVFPGVGSDGEPVVQGSFVLEDRS